MSFIQQFFTSRDNNANAATFVGQEGRLWWDPITNQIYSSDGNTPGGIPLSGGGGNGSPGGANSQVQFNRNGTFGGSGNLTFNVGNGALTAVSFIGDGSQLTNIVANTANYALTANTANTAITVTGNAQPNITSLGNLINVQFNTGLTPITAAVGQLFWDTGEHTITLGMENGVQQQIGLEQYMYIKASAAISDGQVVMFTGANGNNLLGAPADTTVPGFRPEYIMGIATQDIANNGFGYVTTFGLVHGLNTNPYTVGDILWVDNATPGGLTNTQPSDPNFQIQMAAVTKKSGGDGHIMVRPTPFYDINRITNINTTSPTNGQVLTYNGANSVWINANAYGNSNVVTLLASFDGHPISTTGNISAGYFIGNGSHLTSITAANVTGNVANATYATTAGTAGTVTTNAQPNITSVGTLTSVTSTGNISTTGNVIGNYVIASGGNTVINSDITTTGNVVASYFKGDGSLLVGIAPAVQVYEFANTSSGISTYLTAQWLANYTPGPVVDIPVTISTTPTYLAGFITQSGYPNITVIPVGTMAVSIVLVKSTGSKSYVAFAEIYKRDVSGTETLITTTDLSNSIAVNTAQQITLAAYFSTPVSLNATDRIVTKIYAYTSQGTDIITFRYEDNTGTGLQLPVLPASAGSFVPYTNPTANLAMGSYGVSGSFFSATGNVTGNYFIGNGSQLTGIVSSYGNASVAANLAAFGSNPISTTANITTTANISGGNLIGTHVGNVTGTTVSATGNVTGGNLITSGLVSATGNIIGGNIGAGGSPNYYNLSGYTAAITIVAPTTGSAIIETVGSAGNAGTIAFGNVNFRQAAISSTVTNDLSFFVNFSGVSNSVAQSMVLYSNLNARFSNAVSAVGNITGGNLTTAGLITATGNITGGNLNATGLSLTGNVVSAINTTANITTTANISAGNLISVNQVIAGNGSITQPGFRFTGDPDSGLYLTGDGNIAVVTNSGIRVLINDTGANITGALNLTSSLSATGNLTAGNILTAGLMSATSNITGGNINTGAQVVATGNITGGNLVTAGKVTATGTITSTGSTNSTAFAVGNSAVSNVALGMFPTAGTAGEYAIRDYSTVPTNLYFDVAISNTGAGGNFVFRGSSSFTTYAVINSSGLNMQSLPIQGQTPYMAKSSYNVALDTVVTVDNLKYRVSNQGGVFPQIASASGSTTDVCYDVLGIVNGATNPAYAQNTGIILAANGTWVSVYSTHGMDNRGDRLTMHVTDKAAGKIYRVTYLRTNAGATDGYNIIVERIL